MVQNGSPDYPFRVRFSTLVPWAALAGVVGSLALGFGSARADGFAVRKDVIPISEIKKGMKGYGLTVFAGEIHAAVRNANDRLYAVRLIEADYMHCGQAELGRLEAAWRSEGVAALRRELRRYHRRRLRLIPIIVSELNRSQK